MSEAYFQDDLDSGNELLDINNCITAYATPDPIQVGCSIAGSLPELVCILQHTGLRYEPHELDAADDAFSAERKILLVVTPRCSHSSFDIIGAKLTTGDAAPDTHDGPPDCLDINIKLLSDAEADDDEDGGDEEWLADENDDSDSYDDEPGTDYFGNSVEHLVMLYVLPAGISKARAYVTYPDEDEPDDVPLDPYPESFLLSPPNDPATLAANAHFARRLH